MRMTTFQGTLVPHCRRLYLALSVAATVGLALKSLSSVDEFRLLPR